MIQRFAVDTEKQNEYNSEVIDEDALISILILLLQNPGVSMQGADISCILCTDGVRQNAGNQFSVMCIVRAIGFILI